MQDWVNHPTFPWSLTQPLLRLYDFVPSPATVLPGDPGTDQAISAILYCRSRQEGMGIISFTKVGRFRRKSMHGFPSSIVYLYIDSLFLSIYRGAWLVKTDFICLSDFYRHFITGDVKQTQNTHIFVNS